MLDNFSNQQSRRGFLLGIGTSVLLALHTGTARAGGDGGNQQQETNTGNSNATTKKSKKKVTVIYTKKNFKKINKKDLKTAIKGIDQGHNITVEGFSTKMSRKIFSHALIDQDWTGNILWEMARVAREHARNGSYGDIPSIIEIHEGLIKARKKEVTSVFTKDPEVQRYKKRIRLLKDWKKNPSEGHLRPKS